MREPLFPVPLASISPCLLRTATPEHQCGPPPQYAPAPVVFSTYSRCCAAVLLHIQANETWPVSPLAGAVVDADAVNLLLLK